MLIKRGFPGYSGLKLRQRSLPEAIWIDPRKKKAASFCKVTDRPGKSENLFQVAALPYGPLNLSLARLERLIIHWSWLRAGHLSSSDSHRK
jgi:hypothetical protein